MIKRKYLLFHITFSLFVFLSLEVNAQTGSLKGIVIDKKTKEPIPFANVFIEKDGKIIAGSCSDINGNYIINSIIPGIYDLKIIEITHCINQIKDIAIKSDIVIYKDFVLKEKPIHGDYEIFYSWKIPLIYHDPTPSGQTYTSEEINKIAW